MEIFTCDSCFKVFKHKGNYKAHLRRLTQCGIPSDYIAMSEPNELSCSICFKEFVNKHSRIRHEKTTVCSLKIEKAQKENAKIKELEEEEDDEDKEKQCSCCFKNFTTKYKKIAHEKTSKCFSKSEAKGEKDKKYLKLEKEIKELKNEMIIIQQHVGLNKYE